MDVLELEAGSDLELNSDSPSSASEADTVVDAASFRKRKSGETKTRQRKARRKRQREARIAALEDAARDAETPEGAVSGSMVDSHFHLDWTLRKFKLRSLEDLEKRVKPSEDLQYRTAGRSV